MVMSLNPNEWTDHELDTYLNFNLSDRVWISLTHTHTHTHRERERERDIYVMLVGLIVPYLLLFKSFKPQPETFGLTLLTFNPELKLQKSSRNNKTTTATLQIYSLVIYLLQTAVNTLGLIWTCLCVTCSGGGIKVMTLSNVYQILSSIHGQKKRFRPMLCMTLTATAPAQRWQEMLVLQSYM